MKKILILMILFPLVCFGQTNPHITQIGTFENLAELRASAPSVSGVIGYIQGHTTSGDGGGGRFQWVSDDSRDDDGGVIIKPTATLGNGRWVRQFTGPVNVKWFGATGDNSTDDYAAIRAAIDSSFGHSIYFPQGKYRVSQTLDFDKYGMNVSGFSKSYSAGTLIQALAPFTGDSVIEVKAINVSIRDLSVIGSIGAEVEAIRITGNSQMTHIQDVIVRLSYVGVHLISGNAQRWVNVFAESNRIGFQVSPDSGNNCNGGYHVGLRAFSSREWGLKINQREGGTGGMMSSTWDISTEGGVVQSGSTGGGISIGVNTGWYNMFTLYSESNAGPNFSILGNQDGNVFFFRNNDNESLGVFDGWMTSAANSRTSIRSLNTEVYRVSSTVNATFGTTTTGRSHGTLFEYDYHLGGTANLAHLSSLRNGNHVYVRKVQSSGNLTLVSPTAGGFNLYGDSLTIASGSIGLWRIIRTGSSEAMVIREL